MGRFKCDTHCIDQQVVTCKASSQLPQHPRHSTACGTIPQASSLPEGDAVFAQNTALLLILTEL